MFRLHFDSFIENFGTHVITSITIGGKDVIYVKQHHTSPLLKSEMKNYTEDLGNQRFSDTNSQASADQARSKDKASSPLITLTFFLVVCVTRKYEEIKPPEIEEFCYITDNTYTKEEVIFGFRSASYVLFVFCLY